MKAAQIKEYGDASVIEVADIAKPGIQEGYVLIEVHAASLNPFDTIVRAGYLKDIIPLQFPFTPGGDVAGVVAETGGGVTSVVVGDSVYGQANVVAGNSGAFAEYAATSASQVTKMPENLDFKDAATLPLVGVSALQGLTTHINLQPGQKIFIHGGAGAVGRIAVQLAKHIGAYVATTATGNGVDMAKAAGADEVIDYKAHDFADVLSGYDAVFDTVGGDDFTKSFVILNKGGTAVSMVTQVDAAKAAELGVNVLRQDTQVTTNALDALRSLVESGVITASVGEVFSLDDVQKAFVARESGAVVGKVVLKIK